MRKCVEVTELGSEELERPLKLGEQLALRGPPDDVLGLQQLSGGR